MSTKREAQELIKAMEVDLYNYYLGLAVTIFQWKNLPEGLRSERLERILIEKGQAVFFEDDKMGFMTLPVAEGAKINVYGEPTAWTAVSRGGEAFHKPLDEDDSVLIWNNEVRQPLINLLDFYVKRLVDIEFTIQSNQNMLKSPFVFSGNEDKIFSFKKAYEKIVGNEPVIFKNDKMDIDAFQVHQSEAQYYGEELVRLKHEYLNDIYTYLGIENANTDKKERMIVDEVNANKEQILNSLSSRLEHRQRAVEKINDMFGLDISVELNEFVKATLEDDDDEEVDDNAFV